MDEDGLAARHPLVLARFFWGGVSAPCHQPPPLPCQPKLTEEDALDDDLLAAAADMATKGTKYTKDDVRFPNTSRAQTCWCVSP